MVMNDVFVLSVEVIYVELKLVLVLISVSCLWVWDVVSVVSRWLIFGIDECLKCIFIVRVLVW